MAIGVSFLDELGAKLDKPSNPDGDRYQEAVQILSMRLPRVVGGGGLAPAPLLQSMGGAGSPFAQSSVQQAFAQMAGLPPQAQPGRGPLPSGAPQMPAMPQQPRAMAPTPRVIPGITSPDDLSRGPQDFGPNAPGWTPPPAVPDTVIPNGLQALQAAFRKREPPLTDRID